MAETGPRTFLITGGARGMGALTAWALAQRGDTVLIVDWEGEAGARLEAKLRAAGYAAHFLLANLAEKDEVEALATRVQSRWPRLDLLLCNAGITYPEFQQNRAGVDMHLAACHLGHFCCCIGCAPAWLPVAMQG